MGYSKEIYQKAQQELDRRRSAAQQTADIHREAAYAAFPQLQELDRQLSQTGIAAAKAAISGGQDAQQLIHTLQSRNQQIQEERAALLRQAGMPDNFLKIHYTCPKCEDTGYIGQKQCTCLKELLQKYAYEKLGENGNIQECRFDNFSLSYYPNESRAPYGKNPRREMELIFSACKQYASNFSLASESLLLLGGTGLGKTHLSLAIAREVTRNGFGVVYVSSQRLLDKLQQQQFSRHADQEDYQSIALACDLLIVDDLGAEFSTNFTVSALYSVVNSRINERRPTIISTNLDENTLRERYGDRILSRLLCTYRPYHFCGDDVRMIKRIQASRSGK